MNPYYQPNFYNPQYQQPQQTTQNGSFISVPTEEEAYNWPVVPGNSVRFTIENQPIVIEKIQGFSQFEKPVIKRYRLVEEAAAPKQQEPTYALKTDLEEIRAEMEEIREKLRPRRKKVEENEPE